MTNDSHQRRQFLYKAGIAMTTGLFAGCTSDGSSSNDSETAQTAANTANNTSTATSATTTSEEIATETVAEAEPATEAETTAGERTIVGTTDSNPVTEPAPKPVDEYLSDANFYDGNMVVGVPLVAVGTPGPKTGFDPAAIKVATGTEVTWEWANDDQAHTVTSAPTSDRHNVLDSGTPKESGRATYRHTFEEPGIYRYICGVHRAQTARGVVVVAPKNDVGGPGSG